MSEERFAYVLKLVKRKVLQEMSPKEESIINEHFEYLENVLIDEKLVLAGRCLDGEFGIVLFRNIARRSREHENDPAVRNHVMTADLHPFRIAINNRD